MCGRAYCSPDGRCLGDQPLGAPCADGAACVHGYCVNGVCCTEACDDACQACDLPGTEGFCTAMPDGGPCAGGACCDGACVDTASDVQHCGACDYVCPADACNDAVCTTGGCGLVPVRVGEPCDDGNACTVATTCQPDGACRGTPRACTALDDCHAVGVCDPATGCSHPNKPDDVVCHDGNACTEGDTCQAGVCTGGYYFDPCGLSLDFCGTGGRCDPGTGACVDREPVNEGSECFNVIADACTVRTECQGGACTKVQQDCSELADQCNDGACNLEDGSCIAVPKPDDTHCDYVDLCGAAEGICQQGACALKTPDSLCGNPLTPCLNRYRCRMIDGASVACEEMTYKAPGETCGDNKSCEDAGSGRTTCECDSGYANCGALCLSQTDWCGCQQCEAHEICCRRGDEGETFCQAPGGPFPCAV